MILLSRALTSRPRARLGRCQASHGLALRRGWPGRTETLGWGLVCGNDPDDANALETAAEHAA